MKDIPIQQGYLSPNIRVLQPYSSPRLCNAHNPMIIRTLEGRYISMEPDIQNAPAPTEAPICQPNKVGLHIESFPANTRLYTQKQFDA